MSVALRPFSTPSVSFRTLWEPVHRTPQILFPKPDLGCISQLPRIARIPEHQAQAGVWVLPFRLLLVLSSLFVVGICQEQIFRVGFTDNGAEVLDFFHALSEPSLEAVAEALTSLPAAGKLDGELLSARSLPLWIWNSVPGGYGQCEHVALTVQPLDPANGA